MAKQASGESSRAAGGGGGVGKDSVAALEEALADEGAPRFSVGQAAELLGVRPWFLRRLDTLGLVSPSRSGGDQRRYSRRQLGQVAEAKAMMDDGVSTEGVRRVMALQAKVDDLEAQLADSRALLKRRKRRQVPEAVVPGAERSRRNPN